MFSRRYAAAELKPAAECEQGIAEATATAEEAFSQIRTVQSFVREGEETRRFGAQLDLARGRQADLFELLLDLLLRGALQLPLRRDVQGPEVGHLRHQHLLRRRRHARRLDHGVGHRPTLQGEVAEAPAAATMSACS